MSIGVPLPHLAINPPQPNPTSEQPVAPDAGKFRDALYDARRELMRARAAALPFNVVLGGFTPALIAGKLVLSRGVAQLRIPVAGWTATYPPTTKLYAPDETPDELLSGATTDGAYRVERRTATTISAGNGTTGPATGDSIVYLTYDETAPDRVRAAWSLVGAFTLNAVSVPVAWVRVSGGAVTMVRDLRPPPPWRPRYAQRVYNLTPDPVTTRTFFPLDATGAPTLIPVDIGSYWLEAGQGLLLTTSVMLESRAHNSAHEGTRLEFGISRGDPDDGFTQPHYWYGSPDATIAPRWTTSFMNVGRNWFTGAQLFLPRVFPGSGPDEVAQAVPGVFHLNGIFTAAVLYAWVKHTANSAEGPSSGDPSTWQLGARFAYLKAELVQLREADCFAELVGVPPLAKGSLPQWGAQSYPPVPTQRTT